MTKDETAAVVQEARDQLQKLNSTLKILAEDHGVEVDISDHTMSRHSLGNGPPVAVKRISLDFVQRL